MISHWLESRALLVQSKTSGMSLSEPISLCALEIITFIAWIAGLGRWGGGGALWLLCKYVEVVGE